MLMVSQFGRDWIELYAQMSGYNSLGQLEFSILIVAPRTTIPFQIVPNGMDPPPLSRPFRFKEMWLSDEGCGRIVKAVWHDQVQCDASHQVMKKVDKCGFELTFWSCKHFGNVRRELKEKKKLLEKAEQVAVHTGNNYQVRELKNTVMELMIKENMMWRQRAKIFWLIGGDKNMKYFHNWATQRHR